TVLLLTVGAALHQSYVSFFHFQIAPFHVAYLTGVSFLAANRMSLIDTRVFVTLAIGTLLTLGTWVIARRRQTNGIWAWTTLAILAVISLGAHNRNIKYRVQWFVPENVQVHPIERLYLSW